MCLSQDILKANFIECEDQGENGQRLPRNYRGRSILTEYGIMDGLLDVSPKLRDSAKSEAEIRFTYLGLRHGLRPH